MGPDQPLALWYDKPASAWTEALPVGNGRIAGMVFGGVTEERIQLNEATIWQGGPYDPVNPAAKDALPTVREMVWAGRQKEAHELITKSVLSVPPRQAAYQTFGNLRLDFDLPPAAAATEYRRWLDLDRAVAVTTFKVDGVTHTREVFCSHPSGVMVVRLMANKPGSVSVRATLNSPMPEARTHQLKNGTVVLQGQGSPHQGRPGQIRFRGMVNVSAESGERLNRDDAIEIRKADGVTLVFAANTNFRRFDDLASDPTVQAVDQLSKAIATPYEVLLARHIADHQALFRRVSLDLGTSAAAALPTDVRVEQFGSGPDPALAALFFQYGRYLMIAGSRPGGQPLGLQGLWNEELSPPWGGKYTININTEMNYWPAETTNLSECAEPLFQMVRDISETGARTASSMYDARLGDASQHRPLAGDGADRWAAVRHVADGRGVAGDAPVGTLPLHPRSGTP